MKVGILTFPNSISYGATLQMYATYHTVNRLGYEAEVINYHNAYMKAEKHFAQSKLSIAKSQFRKIMHHRLYRVFRDFENKKMISFPHSAFQDRDCLREVGQRYGAVICGSDQVWNPDITDGDLSFFLDFCGEKTRRIAYAPSFGVEELPEDFKHAVATELSAFHAVSVREESGRKLVKDMLGREVPIVLDPTMLLNAEDWSKMEKTHRKASGDYIFYYTIKRSDSLMKFCRELSKKTGMKIVVAGGNFLKNLKNRDPMVEYAVDISPQEWLYLLHHANYVVTNSFHGTAFSINFRKDFYVEFSSHTNSRLANIVQMLGLEERVVKNGEIIVPTSADYRKTDLVLPELYRQSMTYLTEALREGEARG